MGELIQIGDIQIRNNPNSNNESDFSLTHCAKMDCHACCTEMTIPMTVGEFIAYKEKIESQSANVNFIPVPCNPSLNPREKLNLASEMRRNRLRDGNPLSIYYQTNISHKPGKKGDPIALSEMKTNTQIWVLIDCKCPNLVRDIATGAMKCSIFGQKSRPSACSGLEAKTQACQAEMQLKQVYSLVEQ